MISFPLEFSLGTSSRSTHSSMSQTLSTFQEWLRKSFHSLSRWRSHLFLQILKDLHYLMKIFNTLADLCQQQPNYIEAFVQVLQNCVKPFLLDKSTDAEIYSSALVAFYADFGIDLHLLFHVKMRPFVELRLSSPCPDQTHSTMSS